MYLKSIELQGFKSFADAITFHFDKGISAIVGPNGSGKSNVVDAIRWVLGEQSAKSLRGGRMEDVIFSGSDVRKPVGMARVTLILDNSEKKLPINREEIEVQRTLHRSGDSEYRINRRTCRLRDIHELFMDTGIGRDGFSVIGQGKIDEILVQHAEERRALIEEAAGISKYKYRKREAERKLSATQDDMERLEDILFELQDRLGPLAEQAERVIRYRTIKTKEDTLQLAFLTQSRRKMASQLDKQKSQLDKNNSALEARTAELHKAEANRVELLQERDQVYRELEDLQQKYTQSARKQEALDGHLAILREKEKHLADQHLQNEKNAQRLEVLENARREEVSKGLADILEANRRVQKLEENLTAEQAILSDLEEAFRRDKNRSERLKEEQFRLFSVRAERNNERTRMLQAQSGQRLRQQKTAERMNQLKDREKGLLSQIRHTEKRLKELESRITNHKAALDHLNERVEKVERELAQNNAALAQRSGEQQKKQSRLDTLQELEISGEGYYAGVQGVLKGKNEGVLQGIQGTVAQLLNIPDIYLTALENVLGGAAQNVVVSSDQEAAQAIEWLKEGKRGRVTFMPMNTVKGEKSNRAPKGSGIVGLAADLVSFKPAYQGVMHHLLGRIWVVEDLNQARRIARENGQRHRLVTLEGEIISPGGTMSGGRLKKQSSFLRRKKDIQDLEKDLKSTLQALHMLEKRQAERVAIKNSLSEERECIQQDIQNLRLEVSEQETLQEQLERQFDDVQRELQLEEQDGQSLYTDLVKGDHTLETLQKEIEDLDLEVEVLEKDLKELLQVVAEKELKKEEVRGRVHDLRVELAGEKEKAQHANEQQKQAQMRLSETEEERIANANQEKHLAQEKELLNQSFQETKEEAEENALAFLHQEKELKDKQDHYHHLDGKVISCDKALQAHRKEIKELQTRNVRNRTALERTTLQMERIAETLLEQLQLTVEEALEKADDTLDISNATERLRKFREERQALGELNFTAVEEHRIVEERVNFLDAQLSDLQGAKEKLEKVIGEMESTMSRRFKTTFDQVNTQFGTIFERMFEGGQANLELSLPGNYLETGVEIIAQPPGKKASVLTLLSGGERAMTAIALLFALQEVRPSPFVILDEIEAALDEANIVRFAGFLKKYASHTQFIIISHRRGTIEAASVLYGITMDQSGVSKQISVRLTEDGEEE